jgi:hypothetical protein
MIVTMSYGEDLADRIRERIAAEHGYTFPPNEKK